MKYCLHEKLVLANDGRGKNVCPLCGKEWREAKSIAGYLVSEYYATTDGLLAHAEHYVRGNGELVLPEYSVYWPDLILQDEWSHTLFGLRNLALAEGSSSVLHVWMGHNKYLPVHPWDVVRHDGKSIHVSSSTMAGEVVIASEGFQIEVPVTTHYHKHGFTLDWESAIVKSGGDVIPLDDAASPPEIFANLLHAKQILIDGVPVR